jgi:alkanesulfonate monooxygenase SsuD/methylene tetrahydromethanopterin reductase-like flavin-dependent oxidoreductase (luciferase family)
VERRKFENFCNGAWPADDAARYPAHGRVRTRAARPLERGDVRLSREFYTVDHQGLPLKSVHLPNPPLYAGSRHDPGKDVIARDCDYWFVDCLTDYRLWEQNVAQATVTIARDERARGTPRPLDRLRHVVPRHLREYDRGGARARRPTGEHGKTTASPSSPPRPWGRDWSARRRRSPSASAATKRPASER